MRPSSLPASISRFCCAGFDRQPINVSLERVILPRPVETEAESNELGCGGIDLFPHDLAQTGFLLGGERLTHAAVSLTVDSAERSSGKGVPALAAAKRRCASRDDGMPIDRQLWTVDTGASISFATADVPPR